jgi:flagellin
MALTDFERLFVANTANALWQQDWLLNVYFQGSSVGANLRRMVLGQPPLIPLTNPSDEAITGKLRSDAGGLRQNARNVREAASMVGTAAGAVTTMKDALKQMKKLADDVDAGNISAAVAQTQYNALYNQLQSTVTATQYNGIPLLNGAAWGTEQITTQGQVYIQGLPQDGFHVVFQRLDNSSLIDWTTINANLSNPTARANAITALSSAITSTSTLADIYTKREEGLRSQASILSAQADLLAQAAEARRKAPTLSIEEVFLRLLLRSTGTIMDLSS